MAQRDVTSASGEVLFSYELPIVRGPGWELDLAGRDLSPLPDAPDRSHYTVAYLTATYAPRRGFMPFARAQFEAQTHPSKLWIVADASPAPNRALARQLGETYLHLPGGKLWEQRDALLNAARRAGADWFTWLDDDDLHDPRDVATLLRLWNGTADVVTVKAFMALDCATGETRLRKAATILNNNALYRTQRCANIRHPQSLPEDGPWVMQISTSRRVQRVDGVFMWLAVHGDNLVSNQARQFGYMTEHYTTHVFRDQTLYESKLCAYSTTDWERFKQYMRTRHGVTVTKPPAAARTTRTKRKSTPEPAKPAPVPADAAPEKAENDDKENES